MQHKYYYSLKLKHLECWSNFTSSNYSDFLIDDISSIGVLKATRIAIVSGDGQKKSIKNAIDRDKSILDYNIENILLGNSKLKIIFVDMLQKGDNTILGRLRNFNVVLINAKIYNGIEEYQFITTQDIANKIFSELNTSNSIKILDFNYQKINNNVILRAISRNVTDILLTDKQKKIISRARELGYFEVPRKVDLDDIAEEFGVTKMAASILLRIVIKKLLNII
ncbi:helix-turn-helix domain-containing protein [Acidianus sp. HS-5]|uniref:helix-turn-helix domain-containing protein n=1 Tax=Acidianus sp. HS-5 TaxID=2886040 RepID=UPI001F1E1940|nr:helix-turn-helix domain-containing protein [Acidianus sp. HS-5]BDC18837.1 hypothetical protein HS5_17270 [Acidianus sp. HS-5]